MIVKTKDLKEKDLYLTILENAFKKNGDLKAIDFDYFGSARIQWPLYDQKATELAYFYPYFLLAMNSILHDFIIESTQQRIKKNFIQTFWSDEVGTIVAINNLEQDGYIYFAFNCTEIFNYTEEEPSLKSDFAEDFTKILEALRKLDEAWLKRIDRTYSMKYTAQQCLHYFLPSFIENIYDIPKDSILWESPLLKETMADYETLKEYAEKQK